MSLAIVLALIIFAFNWTTYDKKSEAQQYVLTLDEEIAIEPPRSQDIPPPPPPPPPPAAPLRVGGDIKEPKKTRDVRPIYPKIAQAAKVAGVVILEATISKEGEVRDVKVLRSIPMLDNAALDAVRQWRYTPPLLNGVPVDVIMTVTVNFTLN